MPRRSSKKNNTKNNNFQVNKPKNTRSQHFEYVQKSETILQTKSKNHWEETLKFDVIEEDLSVHHGFLDQNDLQKDVFEARKKKKNDKSFKFTKDSSNNPEKNQYTYYQKAETQFYDERESDFEPITQEGITAVKKLIKKNQEKIEQELDFLEKYKIDNQDPDDSDFIEKREKFSQHLIDLVGAGLIISNSEFDETKKQNEEIPESHQNEIQSDSDEYEKNEFSEYIQSNLSLNNLNNKKCIPTDDHQADNSERRDFVGADLSEEKIKITNLKNENQKIHNRIFGEGQNLEDYLNQNFLNEKVICNAIKSSSFIPKEFLFEEKKSQNLIFMLSKSTFMSKELSKSINSIKIIDSSSVEKVMDILEAIDEIFKISLTNQFVVYFLENNLFSLEFMKNAIIFVDCENSLSDLEKLQRVLHLFMVFVYVHIVIQPILPLNKRRIRELEFDLVINLYLHVFGNKFKRFEKVIKIENKHSKLEKYKQFSAFLDIIKFTLKFTQGKTINFDSTRISDFEKKRAEHCEKSFRTSLLYLNKQLIEIKTELLPILINEPYSSSELYLQTIFSLLKEDCFVTLKKGIKTYEKTSAASSKNEFIKSHDAKISQLIMDEHNFGMNIHVYFKKRNEWAIIGYLKRHFMRGSLLAITANKFKSFYCFILKSVNAICRKDQEGNYYIEALVEIADSQVNLLDVYQELKDSDLEIAESPAYYEAYVHVLSRIQEMSVNPNLEDVIVFCKKECNTQPRYLQLFGKENFKASPSTGYFNPDILSKINGWFDKNKVILDKSQKEAVDICFKNKLTLIQGPPGTGKTFVGVNIVRILLEIFKKSIDGPIIVICYTNHALDQFLELILQYTKQIVRFGTRSKSKALDDFSLANLKKSNEYRKFRDQEVQLYYKKRKLHIKKFQADIESFTLLNKCDFIWDDTLIPPQKTNDFFKIIKELYELRKKDYHYILNKRKNSQQNRKDSRMQNTIERVKSDIISLEEKFSVFGIAILFWLKIFSFSVFSEYFKDEPFIQKQKNNDQQYEKLDDKIEDNFGDQEREFNENTFDFNKASLNGRVLKISSGIYQRITADYKHKIYKQNKHFGLNFEVCERFYNDFFQDEFNENDKTTPIDRFQRYLESPNLMEDKLRWMLHFYLCERVKKQLLKVLQTDTEIINYCNRKIKKMESKCLTDYLKTKEIIGVTTTGAAMHKSDLKNLKSKVIIVEEAAEVLEAHILSSLTNQTEHLILIGDHMQLRPSVHDEDLARKYHLDVSMFERLINNNIESRRLLVQRRMRPEISSITRLFYPDLIDHDSVLNRSNVMKLKQNVFFFDHTWEESIMENAESKMNKSEAAFIIEFCKLLVQNGFDENRITILSLYTGQLLYTQKILRGTNTIRNIRIKTVDDYQGEECDIILLSLVRSNSADNIGFLKNDNRVNVALSRAKLGLFIFGNSKCIRRAETKIYNQTKVKSLWLKVLDYMSEKKLIVDEILFVCDYHQKTMGAKTATEITKLNTHSCKETCGKELVCGHFCKHPCHHYKITDSCPDGHYKTNKNCTSPCMRNHGCEHPCNKKCCDCKDSYICIEEVDYFIPVCNHKTKIKCSTKNNHDSIRCFQKCNKNLQCGHRCSSECGKPCTSPGYCKERCSKLLNCGHQCDKKCSESCKSDQNCTTKVEFNFSNCKHTKMVECNLKKFHSNDIKCTEPCNKKIGCGHVCQNKCGSECSLVEECKNKCEKNKSCGHVCKKKCFEDCESSVVCQEKCSKSLECGHKCLNLCFEICPRIEFCKEPCPRIFACGHPCWKKCFHDCSPFTECQKNCPKKLACGHNCTKKCNVMCTKLSECQQACQKKLECNHKCLNECGEKCSLPSECIDKCERILECGHICSKLCGENCQSPPFCKKKCERKLECGHLCTKDCSEDCKSAPFCQKECKNKMKCRHNCKNKCGEKCSEVKDCVEKCQKMAECGHPCQKKCSDPCSTRSDCLLECTRKLSCGHNCTNKCSKKCLKIEECIQKCERMLKCGHKCPGLCGQNCDEVKCLKSIEKDLSCGHIRTINCNEKEKEIIECLTPCGKELSCGHKCPNLCSKPCANQIDCAVKCNKELQCGHICKQKCGEKCNESSQCQENCKKKLDCGHDCLLKCSQPCMPKEKCQQICKNRMDGCNHFCNHPCSEKHFTSAECEEKINKTIYQCGHSIQYLCKERSFYRGNIKCQEICNRKLDCKHLCQKKCSEVCELGKQKKKLLIHPFSAAHCIPNHPSNNGNDCSCESYIGCQKEIEFPLKKCKHRVKRKCCVSKDIFEKHYKCQELIKEKEKCGCTKYKKCFESDDKFILDCDCHKYRVIELKCGHVLRTKDDKSNDKIIQTSQCKNECGMKLACGHLCGLKCFECRKKNTESQCSRPKCVKICDLPKSCEHLCKKKCGEICEPINGKKCEEFVQFDFPCGHTENRFCFQKEDDFILESKCLKRCDKKLECGHDCLHTCNEDYQIIDQFKKNINQRIGSSRFRVVDRGTHLCDCMFNDEEDEYERFD